MEKTGQELSWGSIMPFGKHKGKTVREILKEQPQYITWAQDVTALCFDRDVRWVAEIAAENKRFVRDDYDLWPDEHEDWGCRD